MEGLFFETSPTTPYHFLDQAELSVAPSNPQVGLPYGGLDVALGVQHLQMLGVKYYLAFSPAVIAQADRNPSLVPIATSRHWPAPGVTWHVYLIRRSAMVTALSTLPNVVRNISSRTQWLNANVTWWLHPDLWTVVGAASGPGDWPRASSISSMSAQSIAPTTVSDVRVAAQSLSFHVTRLGAPVLVKVSYYPRWHATGASGPYRVSPNLMVVVPTAHDVTLTYGSSPPVVVGNLISDATVLGGVVALWFALRRRRVARR